MSKSLGNFFTVRDLLDQGWPGEVIRLVFLGTHYRKPDGLDRDARARGDGHPAPLVWPRRRRRGGRRRTRPSCDALANDLNTAGAIAELHRLAKPATRRRCVAVWRFLASWKAASAAWAAAPEADAKLAALIEGLLADRAAARKARDFARADALRDGFAAAGVVVKDTASGVEWELAPDFDRARLEALR